MQRERTVTSSAWLSGSGQNQPVIAMAQSPEADIRILDAIPEGQSATKRPAPFFRMTQYT